MIRVLISVAIGILLIVADWRMSTPPDPKTKRRPPLKFQDKVRLRGMVYWTIGVAVAVWFLPQMF